MGEASPIQIAEVIGNFQYNGRLMRGCAYGNGHINDTYLLTFQISGMGNIKVILQKMNKDVFKQPTELMENVMGVTAYLREQIIKNGGDPERETLNVIPAYDGKPYYRDSYGDYWRSYKFITDATSYDVVEKPEHFYQSAVAFGNFQCMLADYPADTLNETIVGFHDTRARFGVFKKAVEEDILGRAASVKEEIQFVLDREDVANYFSELQDKGELPLRVTHNDTKLNSIRFGASTAAEDEKDLSKVSCSMDLFDLYAKGFIEGCAGRLTSKEIELLPMGAKVMTFECGMRFLTDYLQGDRYFKIHREGHNLDRCRTQFKLVADMETKWETMQGIVKKYQGIG